MVKQQHSKNAFTMLEAIFVLSCVLLLFSLTRGLKVQPSLNIFGSQMVYQCVIAQEKAFANKQNVFVKIKSNEAYFDNERWKYPNGIACSEFSFHYTPNGNISMGKTVICENKNKKIKLVFQLGSGRVRVDS